MGDVDRRDFLALSALAGGAAVWSGCVPHDAVEGASRGGRAAGMADGVADLVVTNATVYTSDDALPRAQAFAVEAGRFIVVGSTDDVMNLAGPDTEVIDAAGMTVVPGFIDAHCHPSYAGIRHLKDVNVDVRSIAGVQSALRERASRTPPGEWINGFLYDDTKLEDGRPLRRTDIDEAVPDHPVRVVHRGGHTAVYNSKAFELAGVTAQTPDPEGGKFYREDGELTGKVAEHARGMIDRLIPTGSTREERAESIALIGKLMSAAGLTSVHETGGEQDGLIAYKDAYEAGELRFRMYYFPWGGDPHATESLFGALKTAGIHTGFGDDWFRIGAVKYGADGSASERTMAMSTPYVGRPDDYGILTMTQEELHEAADDAVRHQFQIGVHANGDRAIDMVLTAYERARAQWPRTDPRFRIEHCSLVNDDLLRRIKAIGAIPTPFYTYVYFHGNKWGEYGAQKMEWMFAHRRFLDAGIPVAGASDYPPGPFEPLMAIQSMVTRTDMQGREWGRSQRVTVPEALRICTLNGAHASFEEDLKGSITAGKLADFVILGADPHETDPGEIIDIPVVRTVVGGRTTHEA